MDALALACPIMLRNLHTKPEYTAMKTRVDEINLCEVLRGLGIDIYQFTDLCILLGCDYCETLKGIGPQSAFDLIKQYYCIEEIFAKARHKIMDFDNSTSKENFNFMEAREMFFTPDVIPAEYFDPSAFFCHEPNYDAAREFLIQKCFQPAKVDKMLDRCYFAHNKIASLYFCLLLLKLFKKFSFHI